ncbi:MAG TPA: hypothetical protein VIF62_30765 [Labilithrix sp.]|jgi:hypothetical protein
MHRSLFALAALACSLVACSGNDGSITVATSGQALTTNGNDKLFTVTLSDGRSDGYDLTKLVVKATPDGKDAVQLVLTVHDTNGNGKLDKDETVDCAEGATNAFDTSLAGSDVKVEMFDTIDGKDDERVGDATWSP